MTINTEALTAANHHARKLQAQGVGARVKADMDGIFLTVWRSDLKPQTASIGWDAISDSRAPAQMLTNELDRLAAFIA